MIIIIKRCFLLFYVFSYSAVYGSLLEVGNTSSSSPLVKIFPEARAVGREAETQEENKPQREQENSRGFER